VVLLIAAALPLSFGTRPAAADRLPRLPLSDWTQAGATTLDQWYDPATGLYRGTGWWNSAHALEAELATSQLHGDDRGARRAALTYARNEQHGFRDDDYYDDEGWWALTWISAFDATGDPRYLRTARSLFDDVAASWDQTCGGGVWWSRARDYKNAITNEVFIELAARLARHDTEIDHAATARYRAWALRGWQWFLHSGMINSAHLVNDGLDASCHNNGRTTWTYNQGVILGAATDLHRLTGDRAPLRVAGAIADAAIVTLRGPDGILHEPCEGVPSATMVWGATIGGCGADGPQFKGIFIRYLTELTRTAPAPRYRDFVLRNAVAIWQRARGPHTDFGLIWSGPFDIADAARQSSALACLNSAQLLSTSQAPD
jgi:predicted alpha-1,6-mannanase (GH76 family)